MLRRPILLCFLALLLGCGPTAVKDPLAGVGGYKLVYQPKEKRTVEPHEIESAIGSRINALSSGKVVVRATGEGDCEILLPGASEKIVAEVKQAIALSNRLKFRIVANKRDDQRWIAATEGGKNTEGAIWVAYDTEKVSLPPDAIVRTTPEGKDMVLILEEEESVDAWHVEHSEVARDESLQPCLHGSMNDEGARRLKRLTSIYLQRLMAIVFDDVVISAPRIQSPIGSQFQITGKFTENELQFFVTSLRDAHALGSLEPTPITEIKVATGNEK